MTEGDVLREGLVELVEDLRRSRYDIGVDQVLDAQRLLVSLAALGQLPKDPRDWGPFLSPILCKSPEEQRVFPAHFEPWVQRLMSQPGFASLTPARTGTDGEGGGRLGAAHDTKEPADLIGNVARYLWQAARHIKPIYWVLVAVLILTLGLIAYLNQLTLPWSLSGTQSSPGGNPNVSGGAAPIQLSPNHEVTPAPQATWLEALSRVHLWAGAVIVLLASWITWDAWWRWRARQFLRHKATRHTPVIGQLFVHSLELELFPPTRVARIVRSLRRLRRMRGLRLDIEATVAETASAAGRFSPVHAMHPVVPRYLVLIDRWNRHDALAHVYSVLVDQLSRTGLSLTYFFFEKDPRVCFAASGRRRLRTLHDLASEYPDDRLLIFGDGSGFLDPLTGRSAMWTDRLARWEIRALLTPVAPGNWGRCEVVLSATGLRVLPADERGINALADIIDADGDPDWAEQRRAQLLDVLPPMPRLLRHRSGRWIQSYSPGSPDVGQLLSELRQFLGSDGYVWLCACAVYPSLEWYLILYLGHQMKDAAGERLLTPERLTWIARLPWFRHGRLPDWLRARLIADLPRGRANEVRAALYALFMTAMNRPVIGVPLEVAVEGRATLLRLGARVFRKRWRDAARSEDWHEPLKDYVFASFMSGHLALPVPRILRRLILGGHHLVSSAESVRVTPRSVTSRQRAWVVAMLLGAIAAGLAAYRLGGRVVEIVGRNEPVPRQLTLPPLQTVRVFGVSGWTLLALGLVVTALGIGFGLVCYRQLERLPVHRSMLEISDRIYESCKTYLLEQGKFIVILWACVAVVMVAYFGFLRHGDVDPAALAAQGLTDYGAIVQVAIVSVFCLVGIGSSYAVAWFGMRVNTFANCRTGMASLSGKARPVYAIPLKAGMSIGMVLISIELLIMLVILLFVPRNLAWPGFIGFAIGESLAAAALRVAGGVFTKIADIGADLMKIVFRIKEDDAHNPGVIADCVGDNAGDCVGSSADRFETYGVTGVALITLIPLAVASPAVQVQLLVWIFVMRLLMIITGALSYFISEAIAEEKFGGAQRMNFEVPLTSLVWITSVISIATAYATSYLLIGSVNGNTTLWWKLATITSCGTLAGAIIPEVTKVFTSVYSRHTREVVKTSMEGGVSLNVLSGLTTGNFSAFWTGAVTIGGLMAAAYGISLAGGQQSGLATIMIGQSTVIFAFGLVAFGFLGIGPATIAVDNYGSVTDNAQAIYELSQIEAVPNIREDLSTRHGITADFGMAKQLLEENGGAGNTFKATAKPVLTSTAVVGATTLILSIIMLLTSGLTMNVDKLSILHAPFLLGIIAGMGVTYWFSGASIQAVVTGAFRAVELIKRNMRLDGTTKASIEDSKRVVAICTRYAEAGMFNIFLAIFFLTLAAAFVDEFLFIGYLIGITFSGLFQAVFMVNAGGVWDSAKKLVETDTSFKAAGIGIGSDLHAATVVGDTIGDPFKDTSSVGMNSIIKFATLFGLLAVELAITLKDETTGKPTVLRHILAAAFIAVALFFVHRSFYGMRIGADDRRAEKAASHAYAES